MDFAVPANRRVKIIKIEKFDKYLYFARQLKKPSHIKMVVIPVVVGDFGTVPKSLEKKLKELEIRWRIETIQTPALLQLAIYI